MKSRFKVSNLFSDAPPKQTYHLGVYVDGENCVFQYRTDKDCLSPQLIEYRGTVDLDEKSKKNLQVFVENQQEWVLSSLYQTLKRGFSKITLDID